MMGGILTQDASASCLAVLDAMCAASTIGRVFPVRIVPPFVQGVPDKAAGLAHHFLAVANEHWTKCWAERKRATPCTSLK